MVRSNTPKRGDVFLVDLNPVVGNEIATIIAVS